MTSPHRNSPRLGVILALAVAFADSTALGQLDPVAEKGVQYLKNASMTGQVGETALMALALIKADVPASDASVKRALAKILARFEASSYNPERTGGPEIYEASVIILALANLDGATYRPQIESAARYILSRQNANGSWDYASRSFGDTSISQYAVLGLWEAENAGMSVPPTTWDRAALWYLSTQGAGGGWTYHRDEGSSQDTISMTAAGVGSLLICERQLAPYRAAVRVSNPLLTPLDTEGERKRYVTEVAPRRINQAAQAGITWLGLNFTTSNPALIGHSAYYALYGIERMGALADQATLGRRDWFAEGRAYLAKSQSAGAASPRPTARGPTRPGPCSS